MLYIYIYIYFACSQLCILTYKHTTTHLEGFNSSKNFLTATNLNLTISVKINSVAD